MSDDYRQLLEATIQHLEGLKSRGARHVAVAPETLRALALPPRPVPGNLRAQVQLVAPAAVPPPTPAVAPKPPEITPAPLSHSALEKTAAHAALRERALACVKCPHLASSRKNVVFGAGHLDAPVMFVGDAPEADEDEQGEPFMGEAGQMLTKIINAAGLSRADVYIAYILKCRPDTPRETSDNRKPRPDEMQTCIPFLHEQIDLIKPKVIVALGATAVEGLLGKTVGISKLRGHWQTYRDTPLMPTYHPAYLVRNQSLASKRQVWEDILAVMEKLKMPISPKQRNFFLKG
jgi:DNA polymerase